MAHECCLNHHEVKETPPPRAWAFVDEKDEIDDFEDEFTNQPAPITTKGNLTFEAIFGSLSLCFKNEEPDVQHAHTFTKGFTPKKRRKKTGRRASMSNVEEEVAHLKRDTLPMRFTVSRFDVERDVDINSEPN
nr:expressed protein [Hymenolepis microstoma]